VDSMLMDFRLAAPAQLMHPGIVPVSPPAAAAPRQGWGSKVRGLTKLSKSVTTLSEAMPRRDAGGRGPTVVFRGSALTTGGEAVLFDTTRSQDSALLPEVAILKGLAINFPDGAPDRRAIDANLALLIFVDDLTEPRARVSLGDLLRHRGERPLNLTKGAGQVLRVVLVDPSGAWTKGSPRIELSLSW
jgi:hypothetical protein